ncbi:hypothetical protein BDD12DRAFT_870961 [Trichophaea hybrida]|nr:hypothetical protein BDD12DRAFT_870961 [Trichophaea hybrida]
MYAGSIPLVVELRGKCIWKDPEKKEGLLAALAIVVDQTKWFSKEKQMLDAQARQEMFISIISRELKTPVAGIIGLLELLYGTRKDLKPEQLNYIRQIFGSVNSLLFVINNVIDFNKIVTGEVSIARNIFILQDLVEELETLFAESMAKQGVHFEVDAVGINKSAFGDGSRLLLLGDDGKIRQIAINILSNAFKFTVRGSVTLRVLTQKVLRNSLEVRFEVEDTGVGISEADQLRLFAPLDGITTKDAKAIGIDGIGLNIARKDGFEATRIIRSDLDYVRWNNLPIVGITATETVGDREKADQCGLNEFLNKPMTSEGIREVIERFIHPMMVGKRRASIVQVQSTL